MSGKFVISKRTNGDFQFNLKAGNGQVILTSQGYADKAGCESGIESVRPNATSDSRYHRRLSSDNGYHFNLLAANGQIIGASELYESAASRDSGIGSVKANAPDADMIDLTA